MIPSEGDCNGDVPYGYGGVGPMQEDEGRYATWNRCGGDFTERYSIRERLLINARAETVLS